MAAAKLTCMLHSYCKTRYLQPLIPQVLHRSLQLNIISFQKFSSVAGSPKGTQTAAKTDQVLHKMKSRKRITPKMTSELEPRNNTVADDKKEPSVEEFLIEKGVDLKKVKAQVDLSKLSLDRVKRTLKIIGETGVAKSDDSKILSRRPRILNIKAELLKKRIQSMRNVGINPDSVGYVISQSPGVLTAKIEESLPEKVRFFEEMDVRPKFSTGEILHVLTKCPDIIATCSVTSLKEKARFFEEDLKFNKNHVKNVVLKQPSVLTFGKNAMREKYNYCYEKINVSPSSIARCPRVFQCSLKRIRERHEFLKHLGRIRDEMTIDDFGLGLIVTTSDKQFVERVAKSSAEEFHYFRKHYEFS